MTLYVGKYVKHLDLRLFAPMPEKGTALTIRIRSQIAQVTATGAG